MKVTVFLFFLSMFGAMANTHAQKISLDLKETSLKAALLEITRQTGYTFIYEEKNIDLTKRISLAVEAAELSDVLPLVFGKDHFNYRIRGKSVSLLPADQKRTSVRVSVVQEAIQGRVLNERGEPLVGATVQIVGGHESTVTNSLGYFRLIGLGANVKIQITFLGYETNVLPGKPQMGDIRLTPASASVQEVEINAGYYTVKERELTGNISKVTGETLQKQPVTNVLSALQGRVAGLEVAETSGMIGSAVKVRLRGVNSIAAGNDPLYLIDGVPFDATSLSSSNVATHIAPGQGGLSPFNMLSAMEIESIEVLKDADATAIYGSRGANGVILITTKRGVSGKTRLNASMDMGVHSPARFMDLLDTEEYIQLRKDAYAQDGVTDYPAFAYDINGAWDQTRFTDWQKVLAGRLAQRLSTQVGLSGGSEQTTFLISGTYFRQVPSFLGNFSYQKAGVHSSLQHRSPDNRLRLNMVTSYSAEFNNLPKEDITHLETFRPPNAPALYTEDGELNWAPGFNNPLAELNKKYENNGSALNSSLNLSYQIVPSLSFSANLGYSNSFLNEFGITPNTVYNPSFNVGPELSSIMIHGGRRHNWIIEPQLTFKRKVSVGVLEALVGASLQNSSSHTKTEHGGGFASNSLLYDIRSATSYNVIATGDVLYKYHAIFGRINYNVDGKYLFNLTARRDGSSRFGPGRQFANFGAFGAAWVFSEEAAFRHLSWLSFGKIRASYGITGNDQIGDYQYLNTFGASAKYDGAIGMTPMRHFNSDFSWETNTKLEIGADLAFLDDRVSFGASFYRNRSGNQLVGMPLSSVTGFDKIQANMDAVVENKGFELTFHTANMRTGRFSWDTDFMLSVPSNRLISFPGLEYSTYANSLAVGHPLTIKKVYHYTGIDPETGIYTFEDVNGDGVITSSDDRQRIAFMGTHYHGSLNNTFRYGAFELGVFFQYVNQTRENYIYVKGATPGYSIQNVGREALDNWTYNKVNPRFQRLTSGSNAAAIQAASRLQGSDAHMSDASFLRLKNVNITYVLPRSWLGVNGRIYAQGQNLLTFSSYLGSDPESARAGSLPLLRVWNFGVQLDF